jgi:prepilin-type N-terminal cleavage/methylation domain
MENKISNRKNGFTMVEIVVVLVIISIIAAIAIPNIVDYIAKASQEARMQTSRSVFYAAQNAVTDRISSEGKRAALNEIGYDGKVDLSAVKDKSGLTENTDNIVFLRTNKSDSDTVKKSSRVYALLNNYLTDSSVLDGTVTVEYNVTSGKVLSAFYSDADTGLVYDDSAVTDSGGDYNANYRSLSNLRKGTMGYYSVNITASDSAADYQFTDGDIKLADYISYSDPARNPTGNNINSGLNYGLLTLEYKLPDDYSSYNYLVALSSTDKDAASVTIQFGGDSQDKNADYWVKSSLGDMNGTITDAVQGANYGAYVEKNAAGNFLVIVMDTASQDWSISNNIYSKLGNGQISAQVTVMQGDFSATGNLYSGNKPVYTYFGGVDTTDGTTYTVSSIRHLSNIRNTAVQNAVYQQTDDLYCRTFDNLPLTFKPIGTYKDNEYFSGKYYGSDDSENYKIYDLTMNNKTDETGLFAFNYGTIDGITLDYQSGYNGSYITGSGYYVGGICAENYRNISRCSILNGKIISETESIGTGNVYRATVDGCASTGGIAGLNSGLYNAAGDEIRGSITKCYVGSTVQAPTNVKCYVGGIAGMNYTEISHCEVGTALGGSGGRPYYGANLSGKYDYPSSCKNNVISVSGFCAGGITGYNTKGVYRWTTKGNEDGTYTNLTDGGTITYCVNAAEVDGGTSIAKECGAGGIAGLMNGGYSESNRSEIGYCYNAGNVNAASSLAVGNAGGLVGSMGKTNLVILVWAYVHHSYNTGNVAVTVNYTKSGDTTSRAGGLVAWCGFGVVDNCYSAGSIPLSNKARATHTGDTFGGGNVNDRLGIYFTGDEVYYLLPEANTSKMTSLWSSSIAAEDLKDLNIGLKTSGNQSYKAGPFNYPYPYINDSGPGSDSHRTPW